MRYFVQFPQPLAPPHLNSPLGPAAAQTRMQPKSSSKPSQEVCLLRTSSLLMNRRRAESDHDPTSTSPFSFNSPAHSSTQPSNQRGKTRPKSFRRYACAVLNQRRSPHLCITYHAMAEFEKGSHCWWRSLCSCSLHMPHFERDATLDTPSLHSTQTLSRQRSRQRLSRATCHYISNHQAGLSFTDLPVETVEFRVSSERLQIKAADGFS